LVAKGTKRLKIFIGGEGSLKPTLAFPSALLLVASAAFADQCALHCFVEGDIGRQLPFCYGLDLREEPPSQGNSSASQTPVAA
jgi:hypothetical protein